jgi:para-nitrobenzyl esterase
MRHSVLRCVLRCVLSLSATAAFVGGASGPVVSTPLGSVRGRWLADGTAEWLGLQYGEQSRWQPPVDRENAYAADGAVYDASRPGPSCHQHPGQIYNVSFVSEDCLFIQGVWSPPGWEAGAKLPVLLWIHGGGLTFGGGSAYNGSSLSSQQGVVVCTINYRLGRLGFLAFPEDVAANKSTGNWGLLDQQSAMRWVRRMIASFGGDPDSVTLFGQSAGGSSVHKHLVRLSLSGHSIIRTDATRQRVRALWPPPPLLREPHHRR